MTDPIHVVGVEDCSTVLVRSDPWVPLTVVWSGAESSAELVLYLRDPHEGYVKVNVDADSGALRRLVLIHMPAFVDHQQQSVALREDLVPALDRHMWPWKETPDYSEPVHSYIDVRMRLTYSITDGRFVLWLGESELVEWLQVGPVRLGLSGAGGLMSVDVPVGHLDESWLED
ncbi:hypothetical protein ACFUMH_02295 [Cellulomonas sp. NPDC057328]|uniref:hypothetical protein n=1 Tax=Cellulomonas sp. NPDC057328 TaxID=3346101 RepID=UPI0036401491